MPTGWEEPNTALCYERLSYSRNGVDEISPKRQRERNQAICEANGWQPEFYADIEGHKSGRFVNNRPGWQRLESRLSDGDVVTLVAYDLARLHRKGWRIGKLLDLLERNQIRLILSDPERQVDTSTSMGKIFIQFMAMADEYYAEDLAIRARGSIRSRKAKGITVSMPPFGTMRDEDGYLIPRTDGVWLLEDGKWEMSDNAEDPSGNALAWRGYFDCAHKILETYATGQHSYATIAELMNKAGWAFRTRHGQPRRLTRDDIRRIIGNVYTYGGIVQNAEC